MLTSKAFMLFLAFSVTEPDGNVMEETFHVMAKRFDTAEDCTDFVRSWGDTIKTRGLSAAQDLVKDKYTIDLISIGCTQERKK